MSTCPCSHCNGSGLEPQALDPRRLVVAIVSAIGARDFTVADLKTFAATSEGELSALLAPHDARTIGWALVAASTQIIDGYELLRIGRERNRVALWMIRPVG